MNLLKSKFFLGVLVVVGLVVAGSTASAAYMHTTLLKMGQSSSQVMSLQQTLNTGGFLVSTTGAGSPGMESMYFGTKTKAAVMAFQAAKGLTVDGIVGAQSGAALAAMTGGSVSLPAGCLSTSGYSTTTGLPCTSTGNTSLPAGCTSTAGYSPTTGTKCDSTTGSTGGSTSNGPLQGGAGSITIEATSDYTSEEVGEGEEEVAVAGFEIEADDESDVEITSVKVMFELTGGTGSDKFDDYAESVQVWMGSEMVGEADVEDFSENSDEYTKSISLDGAIVRAGDTEEFSVSVTALNNLDSGDIGDDEWTVDLENVRFEDAEGVVTTEDTAGDADQTFDFTDFASAADLEVKISLSDEDEINDAHVINVDDNDDTDNVEVLSFDVEADGDSDILINELPIIVTTVNMHVTDGISRVTLWADGEELDTQATTEDDGSENITFEDLDFTIDAGDTVTFTVTVDINDLDATGGHEVADGDTIQVSVGADADWDIEDESGEEVGTGDITGTAAADAHGIYDVGIMAMFDRATATATPSGVATVDDTGTFKIYFDVTAFDSDIYVDGTIIADETGGATYQDIDASTTSVAAGVIECSTCETAANTTFKVKEGQTREFVVTIAGSGADVFASASLTSILYATTPIDGDTLYTFNMTDYKTDSVWLDSN
jgi:hypothetical protein